MEKITFQKTWLLVLTLLLSFSLSLSVNGQCIGDFQFPSAPVVSNNTGVVQQISDCNWTDGDFSVITGLLVGQTYEFTIANGYITITDPSDVVIGHGVSPFTWPSATLSSIRVHYSNDATCAGDTTCRISTIRLIDSTTQAPGCSNPIFPADGAVNVPIGANDFTWSVPTTGDPVVAYQMYYGLTPDNVNIFVGSFSEPTTEINLDGFNTTFYWRIVPVNAGGEAVGCSVWSFTTQEAPGFCLSGTLFPSTTFTPANCDGVTVNTVVTNAWAGEYSNIVVEAGTSYVFQSSILTDFITISDADGGTALAFGTTPLTWESTVTGTIRFYIHLNDDCGTQNTSRVRSIICGSTTSDSPDWANLQWPPNASITQGNSVTVYGQVYVAGLTDVEPNIVGQAPGISAWVGISPQGENTNPASWSTWVPATWNSGHVSNNDEYEASIGANLIPGTYYYAYRYRLNDGPFVYAGVNGFWDATGSISGVLTVNAPPAPNNNECSGAIALTPGATFETNPFTTTNTAATLSVGHPTPTCGAFNFETAGKDVWYTVVVPASGSITIETAGNGGLADTVMAAYTGTCGNLTQVGCNDDTSGIGLFSRIILTGQTPGATIYVRVWGYNGTSGSFVISAFDASLSNGGAFDNAAFSYYPNPVSDRLQLSYKEEIKQVSVFNLLGQEVMTRNIGANEGSIDFSNVASGHYLVRVLTETQSTTVKVIKK
jgi:hypothetical protein